MLLRELVGGSRSVDRCGDCSMSCSELEQRAAHRPAPTTARGRLHTCSSSLPGRWTLADPLTPERLPALHCGMLALALAACLRLALAAAALPQRTRRGACEAAVTTWCLPVGLVLLTVMKAPVERNSTQYAAERRLARRGWLGAARAPCLAWRSSAAGATRRLREPSGACSSSASWRSSRGARMKGKTAAARRGAMRRASG